MCIESAIGNIITTTSSVSKASRHMTEANTQGADETLNAIVVMSLAIDCVCHVHEGKPWVTTSPENDEHWNKSLPHLQRSYKKATCLGLLDSQVRFFFQLIGEMASRPSDMNCESLIFFLRYLKSLLEVIPSHWRIKGIQGLLPFWMLTYLHQSQFVLSGIDYGALSNPRLSVSVGGWIDSICQREHQDQTVINCYPSSLIPWIKVLRSGSGFVNSINPALIVCWWATVYTHNIYCISVKYLIVLSSSRIDVDVFGYKLQATFFITHNYETIKATLLVRST